MRSALSGVRVDRSGSGRVGQTPDRVTASSTGRDAERAESSGAHKTPGRGQVAPSGSSGAASPILAPMSKFGWTSRAPIPQIRARIAAHRPEAIAVVAIMIVAAFLRLSDMQSRADWGSDQGGIMFALRNALQSGAIPQLGPPASVGTFHHGALYYDLMLPGAWLGGSDPAWVLLETALAGLLVVPAVWWVARSIGGPAAGLVAGFLAATSQGLVFFSSFIWNPTLVEPGSALALLGAWQAWTSRRPGWLLVAAAGIAVAIQAHVAAVVLFAPTGGVLAALLWRGPAGQRRRIALWGLASVALIIATYVPLILYEVSHNFTETRGILGYLLGPGQAPSHGAPYRLAVSAVRILSWPLTGWPVWASKPLAVAVAGVLIAGVAWRVVAAAAPTWLRPPGPSSDLVEEPTASAGARARERDGTWLVAGSLGAIILALGIGLSPTAQLGPYLTEQYHVVADPFVVVAAGLVLGSVWKLDARSRWVGAAGRLLCIAALTACACLSGVEWFTSPDPPNWPLAETAVHRIEQAAAGQSIGLVGLPGHRSTDAYGYPLSIDHAQLVAPNRASVVVVLCDASRSSTTPSLPGRTSCGGPAEDAWLAAQPYALGYRLIDRFTAAPDRILSIYGR